MAKEHLKQRIDVGVLAKATEIAKALSKETGVDISVGAIIEKSVNELYTRSVKTAHAKAVTAGQ